jgi:hypothetical protein
LGVERPWVHFGAVLCLMLAANPSQAAEHHHRHSLGSGGMQVGGMPGGISIQNVPPIIVLGSGPLAPGPVALPPLFMPADGLFGPGLMQGGGGGMFQGGAAPNPAWANPVPIPQQGGGGGFGVLAQGEPVVPAAPVRVSNDAARARANRLLAVGDEHFHNQKYHDAYQRYKTAVATAPDMAEAYFRQGLALATIGQYEPAVKSLKRGLQLNSDWPRSQFRLETLYGPNVLAKTAHREMLAQAATDHPQEAGLLFLLAVELYFDNQMERSRPFFLRARALELGDPGYLNGFLAQIGRAGREL